MYRTMEAQLGSGGRGAAVASTAGRAAPRAGAPAGVSTAAGPPLVPAGYVTVPEDYLRGLQAEVDRLSAELAGVREDRDKIASAMVTLKSLTPVLSKIATHDPEVASLLREAIGSSTVSPTSIISPDEPVDAPEVASSSAGATGVGASAVFGPPPARTVSDVRIWTGTWNLGANDPFEKMDVDKNLDVVERELAPFVPRDYDVYVLAVQEAVNDNLYRAVARYTGCYQLPLHAKLDPAKEGRDTSSVRSRRMGHAICVQEFINEARAGRHPTRAASMTDMLDRVWGRGDGALMRPKFTGIAVFVTPAAAPYVRLLGVYKHSFGASEGSKGGVGVALGVYDATMAFISAHMASKRIAMRQQQYCDVIDRLGAKLGGRGFQLTEEFHHIVWMGDLNYHCKDVSAEEAAAMIRQGRVADLLMDHDELLQERGEGKVFYDFEEPNMVPDFYPTYKRIPHRGVIDPETDPDWVAKTYCTTFKEPFYKGGRTVERIPSWTDRIMFRSLPSRADALLPESLDPTNPDAPHNYRTVNNGCDLSDHSPVFCTWNLRIRIDKADEISPEELPIDPASLPVCAIGRGTIGIDPAELHPALRPLMVLLNVTSIRVNYRKSLRSPRALSMLYPLPFEDGDALPERAKIVRNGTIMSMSARTDTREGLSGGISVLLSRANKLPDTHLLLKVSLEDNTKAQAVVSMRDMGVTGVGRHTQTMFVPLMRNGLRAVVGGPGGGPIDLEFVIEYHGHHASGDQIAAARMAEEAITSPPLSPAPRSMAASRLREMSDSMLAPSPGPQFPPAAAASEARPAWDTGVAEASPSPAWGGARGPAAESSPARTAAPADRPKLHYGQVHGRPVAHSPSASPARPPAAPAYEEDEDEIQVDSDD
jgi:hypothetical protein